jgi:hypothetical protein
LSWDSVLKRSEIFDFRGKDKNFMISITNHPTLDDWDYNDIRVSVFSEKTDSDDDEIRLSIEEVALEGQLIGYTKDEKEEYIKLKTALTNDEIEIDFAFRQKPVKENFLNVYIEKASIDIELDFQNTEDIKKAYCTLVLIYTNS